MTQYSFAATVKAMKIQEVILKAASGEILWIDAADIIGVSYRTMKRWKSNYEEFGYDGIFDRRMKSPSPKSAPLSEIQTILRLYRTHYQGFNATHFHEKLKEHHDIHRGYTFVKKLLQTAGLLDKTRKRDKHRIRRPRKPLVGMMLHLDGSSHEWIPDLPGVFYDLLVLLDDATNRIYEMVLVDEEDTLQCMTLLRDCVAKHGIFCSLYSDRATHFFYTPKAGEKVQEGHLTQIGRALNELGIRMIPAYSPQARGRGERMNETLQGRLPNEFRLHGIKTKEQANRFLKDHYIAELNKRFAKTPEQSGSAFVPVAPHVDINLIFSIKSERTVNQDNTVSFQNQILQISPSQLRVSFAKCRVTVHQHLDLSVSITYGPHLLGYYAPNNITKSSSKQRTLCLT
jgi:transposase